MPATLLPTHPARAPQRTTARLATERTTRVLLVEDEPLTAEVFARALTRDGHVVEVATDGLRALHLLRDHQPSLLVLDMSLPTMSGADVVRRIRADGHQRLPIVVVSGSPRHESSLHDHELQPGAWVEKPVKPRDLVALVRRFTQASQSGPQLG
jgi:CheY-like chemotaxis protein